MSTRSSTQEPRLSPREEGYRRGVLAGNRWGVRCLRRAVHEVKQIMKRTMEEKGA